MRPIRLFSIAVATCREPGCPAGPPTGIGLYGGGGQIRTDDQGLMSPLLYR